MNWKEFLKPNWKKVILVLIIGMTLSILGYPCFYLPGGIQPSAAYGLCYIIYFSELFITLIPIIGIFVYLVCLYILSCLIAWIYDKVKKKR